jgi:tetratricopeptide (TPR) repeat protein
MMKKLAIKSMPFLLAAIILFSCKKFLDIKPKGFTIPEYYDDYLKIMNYAQLNKAAESYPAIITDDVQFTSGDSLNNYSSLVESYRRLYSFKNGAVFNDGVSDRFWESAYTRIYAFNTVINNIMKVTDASEAQKKMLKSEALVARAFEYLTLIGAYAKAYDPATAATDYGVPIIVSEDVGNLDYVRNTTAEVYAKIQSDLDEALPDLLDAVPNSFRPAKNVAYAFRARIHLYKGEFDKALENAKSALALKQ